MEMSSIQRSAFPVPHARRHAFSLIELLTVIFIISLLIGILVPSINSMRNAAKKATTLKAINSIGVGLEMFRTDNGDDFRQTNGYPPSFSHPPIPGYAFNAYRGEFPFMPDNDAKPVVYGAHWLPAMLMGVDALGYVKRSSVPNTANLRVEPWKWYTPEPLGPGADARPLDRQPLYVDPGNVKTIPTSKLPGRPPTNLAVLFPDWEVMNVLPVIADSFDQPILYYVANKNGRTTNMVEDAHREDNDFSGDAAQESGPPYYFHQDNWGFTGTKDEAGWDFGGRNRPHEIAESGAELAGPALASGEYRDTFARYIVDRKIYPTLAGNENRRVPIRPVNADSFLLISAGPDGLFGTTDDVSNLPPWPDQ